MQVDRTRDQGKISLDSNKIGLSLNDRNVDDIICLCSETTQILIVENSTALKNLEMAFIQQFMTNC